MGSGMRSSGCGRGLWVGVQGAVRAPARGCRLWNGAGDEGFGVRGAPGLRGAQGWGSGQGLTSGGSQ